MTRSKLQFGSLKSVIDVEVICRFIDIDIYISFSFFLHMYNWSARQDQKKFSFDENFGREFKKEIFLVYLK